MLAAGADADGPERRLAPVTAAADAHADGLRHALHGGVAGFVVVVVVGEREAVFGEEGAGASFLHGGPVGDEDGLVGGRWVVLGVGHRGVGGCVSREVSRVQYH